MSERQKDPLGASSTDTPEAFSEFIGSWAQEQQTLDAHRPGRRRALTPEQRQEELLLQAGHAVRTGHLDFLKWALSSAPQIARLIDPYTVFGQHTLLAQACIDENLGMVRALLPFSDPNARDSRGYTPLMITLRVKHMELTREMMAVSDTSLTDDADRTALDIAAATGRADCVEALLPVSNPRRMSGNAKLTPLRRATLTDEGDPIGCMRLLLPVSDIDQRHPISGHTALHDVVSRTQRLQKERLVLLLEACDARIKNNDGLTPLGLAARLERWALADILSERSDPHEVEQIIQTHGEEKLPVTAARLAAQAIGRMSLRTAAEPMLIKQPASPSHERAEESALPNSKKMGMGRAR